MITRYVSPTGNGNGLTYGTPSNIAAVKAAVAGANDDVTVYLLGGSYPLSAALAFTSSDSPTVGHLTVWQAYPNELPIIECGVPVTGWSQVDAQRNIWAASVPAGTLSRQFWVNGLRANRVRYTGSVGAANSAGVCTFGGPTLARVQDVEGAWKGNTYSWMMHKVQFASQGAGTLTLTTAFGTDYSALVGFINFTASPPSWIENAYEFFTVDSLGEWYLNTETDTIYYVPRNGENMANASCWLGDIEVAIFCTDLSNVRFQGLQIQHTGFYRPSVCGGFVELQANSFLDTLILPAYPSGAFSWSPPPAAITILHGTNVQVVQCAFRHIGGVGVTISRWNVTPGTMVVEYGVSVNCAVVGCLFLDIGSNGIAIGFNEAYLWTDVAVIGAVIRSNYISDVGAEFKGAVAIWGGRTNSCGVLHNHIEHVPYDGGSFGWGWDGYPSSDAIGGDEIAYNYVRDVMLELGDGGGLYFNAFRAVNCSTHDNFIDQRLYEYGSTYGLYYDNGSTNHTVNNNVVWQGYWLYVQITPGQGKDPRIEGNILGSGNWAALNSSAYANYDPGSNINVTGSATLTSVVGQSRVPDITSWPSAAQAIANAAGLESTYEYLLTLTDGDPLTGAALPEGELLLGHAMALTFAGVAVSPSAWTGALSLTMVQGLVTDAVVRQVAGLDLPITHTFNQNAVRSGDVDIDLSMVVGFGFASTYSQTASLNLVHSFNISPSYAGELPSSGWAVRNPRLRNHLAGPYYDTYTRARIGIHGQASSGGRLSAEVVLHVNLLLQLS